MIERGINTVQTSACGRLFDAVASIVGVRDQVNFEAQAAIELETAAFEGVDAHYPFEISSADTAEIDVRPAIEKIARDVLAGRPAGWIAAAFHNTIAAIVIEVCRRLRTGEGIGRVCLSGGTFQNCYFSSAWWAACGAKASRYLCMPKFRRTMAASRSARPLLRTLNLAGPVPVLVKNLASFSMCQELGELSSLRLVFRRRNHPQFLLQPFAPQADHLAALVQDQRIRREHHIRVVRFSVLLSHADVFGVDYLGLHLLPIGLPLQ